MKYLRPRSADSGLSTVLLVSDAELAMLVDGMTFSMAHCQTDEDKLPLKKLRAELRTARGK